MDTIFTAIGVILLKTQPLLVFLGLGSSAIAVQITVLAAITLISIAVGIGIVALIGYGLKKLIKKTTSLSQDKENPISESENDDLALEKGAESPKIMQARTALNKAENAYKKISQSLFSVFKKKQLKLAAKAVEDSQNALNKLLYMNSVITPSTSEFVENKTHKTFYPQHKEKISPEDEQDEVIELSFTAYTPAKKTKGPHAPKKAPKQVQWVLPENQKDAVDITETPEIKEARQNLKAAKAEHTKILKKETQFRDQQCNPVSSSTQRYIPDIDEDIEPPEPPIDKYDAKYWSYVREDAARDKVHMAEEALEKLIITQKMKP